MVDKKVDSWVDKTAGWTVAEKAVPSVGQMVVLTVVHLVASMAAQRVEQKAVRMADQMAAQ